MRSSAILLRQAIRRSRRDAKCIAAGGSAEAEERGSGHDDECRIGDPVVNRRHETRSAVSARVGRVVALEQPVDRVVEQIRQVGIVAQRDHLPRSLLEHWAQDPRGGIARLPPLTVGSRFSLPSRAAGNGTMFDIFLTPAKDILFNASSRPARGVWLFG